MDFYLLKASKISIKNKGSKMNQRNVDFAEEQESNKVKEVSEINKLFFITL